MSKLSITGTDSQGSKIYWCVAEGCTWTKRGNRTEARVYGHAASCEHLQHSRSEFHRDLWEQACLSQKQTSLGAQLREQDDTASESAGRSSHTREPSISKRDGTRDLRQPSVFAVAKDAGKKNLAKKRSETLADLQRRVDHCIMRLICVRGLVPNIIDSSEWKELLTTLNPEIHTTSSSTFVDKHIPKEAVLVRSLQEDRIKNSAYATISFDGTNTRLDSIYFMHATTDARESYFIDAYIGSDARHISTWISSRVLKVGQLIYLNSFISLLRGPADDRACRSGQDCSFDL